MNNLFKYLSLCIITSLLIACGGGGGGGGSDSGNGVGGGTGGGSNGGDSGAGDDNPPVVGSNDATAPTAEIIFPLPVSRTNASTITVRGTASDANAVSAIRVNGVAAQMGAVTINNASSRKASGKRSKTANKQLVTATSTVTVAAEETVEEEVVEWEVELPVPEDSTLEINVETEDEFGNINSIADTASILTQEVPTIFTLDKINHRLIGQSAFNKLIIIDLLTESFNTLELNDINSFENFVYVESIDSLIYTELTDSNLQLYSVDLQTGFANILINYTVDFDTSIWNSVRITNIDYAQSQDELFLLLTYYPLSRDYTRTVIYKYDLDSNTISTIVDDKTASNKSIKTNDLAYTDDGLLIFNGEFGDDDSVSLLEFDGSDATTLSIGPDLVSSNIDVDLASGTAYQTGYDGIASVNLDTGDVSLLSIEDESTEINLTQIRSTGIDLAHNQLLIADDGLDAVISVDLETGERDVFISNGVGDGRIMVAPRELVVDSENNRVYVLDDGDNGPEVLLAIDLETGNRTSVADINQPYNLTVEDLIFDSQLQQLYVLLTDEILKIDIDLGTVDVLSSNSVGTGPVYGALTGGTLDHINQRLIVTDFTKDSILAIDLASGDRSLISTSTGEETGTGIDMRGPTDIAADLEAGIAYVLSQKDGAIYTVALDTGDRALLVDSCTNNRNVELLEPDSGNIQNLILDSERQQLYVTADNIFRYDLVGNECLPSTVPAMFDLAVSDKGQVFSIDFNVLLQLDLESGSQVIFSK